MPSKGFLFYTANEGEKDSITANLGAAYHFEGVDYHVLDTDWGAEKLPHSGLTDTRCYRAGSNTLFVCSIPETGDLSPQQDGHRAAINPMSYSAVGGRAFTTCVRDNVTGLIWEGKEASGLRAGSNTYTNQGGGASTDTSGYVAAVNALNLCGFSDWRLSKAYELQTIVHCAANNTLITPITFANTPADNHWSSDMYDSGTGFMQSFGGGSLAMAATSTSHHVRLVRGNLFTGPRFSFGSVSYAGDAANNLVNDALTGLQWRRCQEGRNWNGSTCTGTASTFTQEQAMAHARDLGGWRVPNVKELGSLIDRSRTSSPWIDTTAFPAINSITGGLWSSTPLVSNSAGAWAVSLSLGFVGFTSRGDNAAIFLVRVNP